MEKIRVAKCRICGTFVGYNPDADIDKRAVHLESKHDKLRYDTFDPAVVAGLFDLVYSANRATKLEAKA
jgi:hypothetical protein